MEYGEDHPNHGQRNGPGEQHHFAFKCDSMEQFKALREQIKNTGTKISRPVDHEICYSCYFDDPNGFQLEITCSKENGQYNETYYQLDLLDRKPFPVSIFMYIYVLLQAIETFLTQTRSHTLFIYTFYRRKIYFIQNIKNL